MSEVDALILIDVQQGLDNSGYYGQSRSGPDAEVKMKSLLSSWRTRSWPIFHIKHDSHDPLSPLYPGKEGNRIKDIVKPLENEVVLQKSTNSAFIGTDLQLRLETINVKRIVLAGLTIEHCVSSTARMASDLGFEVIVAGDATAAFSKADSSGKIIDAELVHAISLANLEHEFARIVSSDNLV